MNTATETEKSVISSMLEGILNAYADGELEADEAIAEIIKAKDERTWPVCEISIREGGVVVALKNWVGVGGTMLDRIYLALLKAAQQHTADGLQAQRIKDKEKVNEQAA